MISLHYPQIIIIGGCSKTILNEYKNGLLTLTETDKKKLLASFIVNTLILSM